MSLQYDEVGPWSEIKLEIIKKYASAYTKILNKNRFHHVYIDAFAGGGFHLSKEKGEFIQGSPLNATKVKPPFKEIHLIDLNGNKTDQLKNLTRHLSHVRVYSGDCNKILQEEILDQIQWSQYKRGLCLLDPYGLQLKWETIEQAGKLGTIDMFLNFPIMDMNRTAILRNSEKVKQPAKDRMTSFWGDESWQNIVYKPVLNLFNEDWKEKCTNNEIVEAFCKKLKKVAKFKHISNPLPMKNSKNSIVYYLIFASQYDVADHIIDDIFNKYR